MKYAVIAVFAMRSGVAGAQEVEGGVGSVNIHGFVSEGAFWSTDNDYIGESSRGSLELFEAAINVSSEVRDRLRIGVQLYARDIGRLDDPPRVDWAYLDYRWRPYLGLRAGMIKMPYGLYNEFTDIDSARLSILMPQSIYSIRSRTVLLAHRGIATYGSVSLASAGGVDYQALVGSVEVPESLLATPGGTIDRVDMKYVVGGQLFWRTPVDGLRVGASYLRGSLDVYATLNPALTQAVIDAGLAPPGYDGKVVVFQDPITYAIGSAEYVRGDWLFAAEYSRELTTQGAEPMLFRTTDQDSERFYALASYRWSPSFEGGGYYSVLRDVDEETGAGQPYMERFHKFQRDLAATVRYDVNENWLWKLEGHFIDGAAQLELTTSPKRYWGLFLIRTTVSF